MPMHPAAVAAAKWWAEQVGCPTFRMTDSKDNTRDRQTGDIAGMMAHLLASKAPVTSDQGERFADALARRIDKALTGNGRVSLDVDYGPCLALAEVAEEAGVSASRFPWKTHMTVLPDRVTASLGYKWRLVWASDEWMAARPACGWQKWDEENHSQDYGGEPWMCSLPQYHEGDHVYDREVALCSVCHFPEDSWMHTASYAPNPHGFVAAEPVTAGNPGK